MTEQRDLVNMICTKCGEKITGMGSLQSKIVDGKLIHIVCPVTEQKDKCPENKKRTTIERFLDKINVDTITGCWDWTASLSQRGYGMFSENHKSIRAHRYSFAHYNAIDLSGLQLDHLCRNRKCVNPDHLEIVTPKQNSERGLGGMNNRIKTHCPQGHPYDEGNTFITIVGRRMCRTCRLAFDRTRVPRQVENSRRRRQRNRMEVINGK